MARVTITNGKSNLNIDEKDLKKYKSSGWYVGSTKKSSSSSSSSSSPSSPSTPASPTGSVTSTPAIEQYSNTGLTSSAEYKALSKEDQDAVLAVFNAVANNDQTQANRLAEAFKAASKINDPYFAQQLRLATDAIERGYVELDKQAEFEETQIKRRLDDLKNDYATKKNFLSLEQASVMKEIERNYTENLGALQENLAASGFTQSSRRIKKEAILDEVTGDLRTSKNRAFAFEGEQADTALARGERDTAAEIQRLKELTEKGKLDFLRKAEAEVGTKNLPTLSGGPAPLGGIYGSLPEEKLSNTIAAAKSFVF